MPHQHNAFRLKPAPDAVEHMLGVAHRIHTGAIPPAVSVLNPMHLYVRPEPPTQRGGNQHHPNVGQLPPSRGLVAARPAARQDQYTSARFHNSYSELVSTRSGLATRRSLSLLVRAVDVGPRDRVLEQVESQERGAGVLGEVELVDVDGVHRDVV